MFVEDMMLRLKQDSLKSDDDSLFARLTDLPMSQSDAKRVGEGLVHLYGSNYEVHNDRLFHG